MKASKWMTAAAAVLGLLGAVGAQADDTKRTVGEYTDDKVLHTKVWAALTEDKTADASEINLEVYKGVVQLNGFVDNDKERAQAETVARGVSGVKDVQNNLLIKQAKETAGDAIDDSTITAKVKSALIDSERRTPGRGSNGCSATALCSSWTRRASCSGVQSQSTTTNSSPAKRAQRSVGRTAERSTEPMARSTRSPASCP